MKGQATTSYVYGQSQHLISNFYSGQTKALTAKTLSGKVGGNSELANWYEQATTYYSAVISGAEPQPDPAKWGQFLEWLNWASQQLGFAGGSWGDAAPASDFDSINTPAANEADRFGGRPGIHGNLIHNEETARIGFTGDALRDIWSNDVTIDVAPLSATVSAEKTTDSRTQPPEEVIKVTVRDLATGTEAIHYIHDFADAKIKINVPANSQVSDHTGGLITVGKFRKHGGTESSEVDVPFEQQENGELLVEVPYGRKVSFVPQGGEDQTWDVYANFDISAKPSDIVRVDQDLQDGYLITVTHKDGSADTFRIHKGFTGNINGYPENVNWGDPANGGTVGEDIPDDFQADITLNSTGSSSDSDNPSTPADETNGNEAVYNHSENVDVYTDFDDAVDTHRITAPGEVIIHGSSYSDTAVINKRDDGTFEIVVFKNGMTGANAEKETYIVDGAAKLTLDFLPQKITGSGKFDPVLTRGLGEYAEENETEETKEPETSGPDAETPATAPEGWPENGVAASMAGQSSAQAQKLAQAVDEAIVKGEWDKVLFLIQDMSPETGNDSIREFMTALYNAVGGDNWEMEVALDLIPAVIRGAMASKISEHSYEFGDGAGISSEKNTWNQYSNREAYARLELSLEA